MSEGARTTTIFLNVDLDLRANHGLDELLRHLEPFVVVLNKTEQDASVELTQGPYSLDQTLLKLIDIVQGLPQPGKEIWKQCDLRRFNVGIQGGHEPHEAHFSISKKTIVQIAGIDSEIVFTVYAPPTDERQNTLP